MGENTCGVWNSVTPLCGESMLAGTLVLNRMNGNLPEQPLGGRSTLAPSLNAEVIVGVGVSVEALLTREDFYETKSSIW